MIIQDALMAEINRLADTDWMKKNGKQEIERANQLNQSCNTMLKAVSLKLAIVKLVGNSEIQQTQISKAIGVSDEE